MPRRSHVKPKRSFNAQAPYFDRLAEEADRQRPETEEALNAIAVDIGRIRCDALSLKHKSYVEVPDRKGSVRAMRFDAAEALRIKALRQSQDQS